MGLLDVVLSRRTTGQRTSQVVSRSGRIALLVVGVALFVLGPFAHSIQATLLDLLIVMLVWALFALSMDFAFGHSGLASFGHAAMYGSGGYAVALLLTNGVDNLLVGVVAAMLTGMLIAAAIGWVSVHTRGVYFAFLTLSFGQMLYIIADKDILAQLLGLDQVTNGANGLYGLSTPTLFGVSFASQLNYYYLLLVAVAVSLVLVIRFANSSFGTVMLAVRENEDRVAFLGYDTRKYKTAAFAISGAFAGLAGGLYAPYQSLAQPGMLYWTTSGQVFIMTLLGGAGSIWGPMVGAVLVVFIEHTFNTSSAWQLILGAAYILVVIFAPDGLAGIFATVREKRLAALDNLRTSLRTYADKVGFA